jgi:hypothetical protein
MTGRCFSADWAKDNERRAAGQRAEQQRMSDYYARQTQQQEKRENAKRFAGSAQEAGRPQNRVIRSLSHSFDDAEWYAFQS